MNGTGMEYRIWREININTKLIRQIRNKWVAHRDYELSCNFLKNASCRLKYVTVKLRVFGLISHSNRGKSQVKFCHKYPIKSK